MSIHGTFRCILRGVPHDCCIFRGIPHDHYHHEFNFILMMIVMWHPTNNTTKVPCVDVALYHTCFFLLYKGLTMD